MATLSVIPAMSVSADPEIIAEWASEAFLCRLYRPDGVAQFLFRGDGVIHEMAYLPGIAWVIDHDWPARWSRLARHMSGFTHPDHRRRGICRALSLMMSRTRGAN